MADADATPGETPEPVEQPAAQVVEEEFDKTRAMDLIKKLRDEVKTLTPKARKAEELEQAEAKRKDAELTETQRLAKELAEAKSLLKQEAKAKLQKAAAKAVGLPEAFAEVLKGETPEELEAHAKVLSEAMPKQEKKNPSLSPTNPGGASVGETQAQRLARIHGSSVDPYDLDTMRNLGGGVFQSSKGIDTSE